MKYWKRVYEIYSYYIIQCLRERKKKEKFEVSFQIRNEILEEDIRILFLLLYSILEREKKEKVCQKIQFSRFENSKLILFELEIKYWRGIYKIYFHYIVTLLKREKKKKFIKKSNSRDLKIRNKFFYIFLLQSLRERKKKKKVCQKIQFLRFEN